VPYHRAQPTTGRTFQYNGNISEQLYNKGTRGEKFVSYYYDKLNRLTAGNSQDTVSENSITYDVMGNIQHLTRFGQSAGTLTYAYTGNQLQTVSGGVTRSYTYDGNGNATSDGQGHAINYNMLNLPRTVPGQNLAYTYDATGQKLARTNGSVTTYYINGIQYTGTNIDFVQTEEGRVVNPTTSPNYEYTLTDTLVITG
jgi:YD repeat-containing protein